MCLSSVPREKPWFPASTNANHCKDVPDSASSQYQELGLVFAKTHGTGLRIEAPSLILRTTTSDHTARKHSMVCIVSLFADSWALFTESMT